MVTATERTRLNRFELVEELLEDEVIAEAWLPEDGGIDANTNVPASDQEQ